MHSRLTATLLVVGLPGLVFAESGATRLEEVVVRAGFYDTKLMTSAGSISVLDETQIAGRGARHLEDIVGQLPNVNFSAGASRARFLQIRGVGDLEQFVDPKHFPSIGVTIDGVEVGTNANGALLMDVHQIEVLRGPQGTRFGANALAGMVNIRTNDPTDTLSGYVNSGYANFDTWHIGGAISGPLSDNVAGRLAIRQNQSDGYLDNAFLGDDDTNEIDEFSTRGKLHWSLGERGDIRLTAAYADLDNGYDSFALDNSRNTLSDRPGFDSQEIVSIGVSSNWALREHVQLETLVSWSDADEDYGFDEDWVFAGFCDGVRCDPLFEFTSTDRLQRGRQVASIDIRLKSDRAKVSWVTGIYAQHRDEDLDRQHFAPFSSKYETDRYAIYGQLILELAPNWTLTGGIRYEHFEDEYRDTNALVTDSTENYWSGELTLEHLLTDNVFFYGTLSRGAKPGGVNTEASSNLPFVTVAFQPYLTSRLQFDAETLFNKEIGVKALLFDDRLSLRLSGFHMDRSNAQLESWIWDATTFIFTGFLDSSSDAENYGAELELNYAANRFAELFANVGYLETEVDSLTVFDLDTSSFRTLSNRDQTKAPNWNYNVGVNLSLHDHLHGRIEVEGRDTSFFGYYHDAEIDAYTLTHASVSYETGPVTVQAWVRNVFDTNYEVHGLYFANDPRDAFTINRAYYQRGEPRVYGVNLSYTF